MLSRCFQINKEEEGNTRGVHVARAPHLLNRGSHAMEVHAHVLIEGACVSHEKDIFVALIKSFFVALLCYFSIL